MENAELKRCLQIAEDTLVALKAAERSAAAAKPSDGSRAAREASGASVGSSSRPGSASRRRAPAEREKPLPSADQVRALLRETFPEGMPQPWVQLRGSRQPKRAPSSSAVPRTIEDVRQAMEQAAAEASEARREATSARSRVQALRTELEELRATHETAISQHQTELARMRVAAPLLALDDPSPSAGEGGSGDSSAPDSGASTPRAGDAHSNQRGGPSAAAKINATAAAALIREVVPRTLPSVGKDPARRAAGLERVVLEQSIAVRVANERLDAIMTTHRQLLRKYAVVDVECSQRGEALAARDERLARMQRENARLHDSIASLRAQARARILSGRPGDLMVMGGGGGGYHRGDDGQGGRGGLGGSVGLGPGQGIGTHGGRVVKPLRGGKRSSGHGNGSGSGNIPGLSRLRVDSESNSQGDSASPRGSRELSTPTAAGAGQLSVLPRAAHPSDHGTSSGLPGGASGGPSGSAPQVGGRLTPGSTSSGSKTGGGGGGGGRVSPRLRAIAASRKRQLNSSANSSAYRSADSEQAAGEVARSERSDVSAGAGAGRATSASPPTFATGWVDVDDVDGGQGVGSANSMR